jgi:hypothetical protein
MINPKWNEWNRKHRYECEYCKSVWHDHVINLLFISASSFVLWFATTSLIELVEMPENEFLYPLMTSYFFYFVAFLLIYSIGTAILFGSEDPHIKDKPKFWIKKSSLKSPQPVSEKEVI